MVGSVECVKNLGRTLLNPQRCHQLLSRRAQCASTKSPTNSFEQPPLSTPLSGSEHAKYASILAEDNKTEITTLPNGLRVASEKRFGQFCTIGVIIESGPRYEVAYPSGISHFMEKLAFHSTEKFSSKDGILHYLEKHGGICDCLASRDTFIYASSADRRGFDSVVNVLSEATLRPKVTNEEISLAARYITFELENLHSRPEQEPLLIDMIHAAAYRDNTLGIPKICPKENINKINRNVLLTFMKNHFTPERMVISGVGIDHQEFVDSVKRHFLEKTPTWDGLPSVKVDNSVAQYTGGLVLDECKVPLHMGPSGLPELAHVVIGLEGCSHTDPDFIPLCVLSVMMGGGGSFSAGGPGKGMYTRLYTNVLNRYHWMFNATAYNQTYADTGLFYIHASAPPSHVAGIVDVITSEMTAMAGEVDPEELRRAKTQLQSMILMNLESRPVMFEDIARQILAMGKRKLSSAFITEIEKVTGGDIERVATRLLRSQPAVAARGDITKLPKQREIHAALNKKEDSRSKARRMSLFT